jgi:hypothetical protein
MSWMLKLIIGGWVTTLAIIAYCALDEYRERLEIRRTIASWLIASSPVVRPSEESL